MNAMPRGRSASTTSSSSSPTSTARARRAPTGCSPRSILRMGVPVASRNIFPSNIQGLPTWYEVRVSEAGHLGRRGGVDLMVAMNPQTWDQDVAEIEPGGYLFYDSTRPLPPSKFRDDITVLGMPLTAICNARYTDPRQRQLFKNIIYVGALAELLGIDAGRGREADRRAVQGQGQADRAEHRGAQHGPRPRARARSARSTSACGAPTRSATASSSTATTPPASARSMAARRSPPGIRSRPRPRSPRPSRKHCRRYRVDPETGKNRYAIVQAEDELASIGMVIGAAWNGARAFTATSGPGISLMQEFIGLAYFAEIPAVIFDVQRGGPSTGMPTRTQQSDILSAAYASHGDTKHVLLFPEDPRECFDFAARGLRSRRPAADAGLRHARPRHRHERVAVQAARLGRRPALRPRQGADRRGARGRPRVRPLSRRRRRRHPLPHLSRHPPDQGRLLHPRHLARTATPATPRKAPTTSTTCSGCSRKFETAKHLVPGADPRRHAGEPTRIGVIYYGSTDAGDARGARGARRRGHPSRHDAPPRLPLPRRGRRLHRRARPRLRRRAEPRRAAAHAAGQRVRHRPGAARPDPPLRRHADHRALHRPRHRRAPRGAQGDAAPEGTRHDLHRQAQVPSPQPAEEQARLHPPRLRGRGLDALRRLRPRFDLGRDHPGLLRARPAAAPGRQDVGHRLLVEDADLFPRPEPRLQQRARPHAVGARPAPTSPTATSSISASPATATPPRSASASSPTASAAASTWSTSSRTTACTA